MDSNTTISSPTRIPPPRGYALSGKLMLSAIVVLFSIVLLLLFIHLYVRWHLHRRASIRLRRRRRRLHFSAADDPSSSGTAIPRGLDPKILSSLAVSVFASDDDVAECAVCLSEFEEGEKVRVLPRCDHRFHIDCIDMWFGSHNSCPLCRSAVEIEAPPLLPQAATGRCADRSVGGSSVSGEVRIEIRREEELGLGSGSNRMLAIKRFLRLSRGEIDIERGEAEHGGPPPLPPGIE